MTESRPLKVFLCHASADKPVVRKLSHRLAAEGWIDPWLDEEKLSFGQHWTTVIEEALDAADIVLIFLSRNSVQKEGFVQRELSYAWDISLEKPRNVIFLIPFRLDDCEVPRYLSSRQWGDYFGEKEESTYQILLRSLKQRHEQKLRLEAEEQKQRDAANRERTEREAKEKAERDAAEKSALEKAERENAELAREIAEREDAREKAEREAAEKSARERVEREAIEKAARENAERETVEKAKREKTERDAAEKAAREKAERAATEKATREKTEREAAEKAAREKAEREATEKTARKKTERETAEKAAREKAEREVVEKAAREKAERQAAENAKLKNMLARQTDGAAVQLPPKQAVIPALWRANKNIAPPVEQITNLSYTHARKFDFRKSGITGIVLISLLFGIFGIIYAINNWPVAVSPILSSNTISPSPTFTLTPTAQPSPTYIGPTPLWAFLPATYTPTPFYMPNVEDPQLTDLLRAIRAAYGKGAWDEMLGYVQQGLAIRPDLADLWFLSGEAYRFQGKYAEAQEAYNKALELNPNFGPAYVGLARIKLAVDKEADVLPELDTAIERDPAYAEAYIVRAAYKTDHGDPEGALADLQIADQLQPESALVYYEFARAYLALGEAAKAVESAQHANRLDITMLPVYLVLGEAYAANDQPGEAIKALETYATYATEDGTPLLVLGKLYYLAGDYVTALDKLERSIKLKNDPEARLYYGLTLVELGRGTEATYELKSALDYFPDLFEAHIGLTRAYMLDGKFGSAALQADIAFPLAKTDGQRAQVYYWRAKALEQTPNRASSAKRDWESLLSLPAEVYPAAWRTEAQEHLIALSTPSPTTLP